MQQNKTVSQQKTINPVYWVPTAYFAMGLPFIAINLVSVFMFKDLGISDTQIAFWTSLIMMPWTLRFLWSPFLEMYRTKKFFVLVTELLSGVLFGIVAFSLFFDYFFAISISTMAVIAFSGATHDIACDGVYMAEMNKEEQAKYIGVQGAFYNVAKLVANGGLVAMAGALAEYFGAIFYRDRIGERGRDIRLDDRYAALRYDHDPAWFLSYEDVAFGWESRYQRTFVEGKYG